MKKMPLKSIFFFVIGLLILSKPLPTYGQKVGLALSGGGADGMAHIGVLKALEENHIPIDYITGTSMGALVGALYASGYSPQEIDSLVSMENFKKWALGEIDEQYVYYFKKKETDASWVNFKFSLDTLLQTSLPTNLISPVPLDFGLMEIFARPTSACHGNFDSLFVPFRCVSANITDKKQTVFSGGDLGLSVRASMSYPFYIKAVNIDNKLYFDGGLYNNFPTDILYNTFKPDIIIGSNVSDSLRAPSEDDLISQIKSIFINKNDKPEFPVPVIIIEPKIGFGGLFNFNYSKQLIQSGYEETMKVMPSISASIKRRTNNNELKQRRIIFRSEAPILVFNKVEVNGLKRNQVNYVRKLLGLKKSKIITIDEIKPQYFRLAADQKIKQIFPVALLDNKTSYYKLDLKIKKEKDIFLSFGGNFSSRPINAAYIGAQYNYLNNIGISILGNTYFGRFYGSYMLKTKFDFPSKLPFYIDASFTRNRWDYFKSSTAFFEESKPSYLVQNENYFDVNAAMPVTNKAKLVVGGNLANLYDKYYQTKVFSQNDTTDRTDFYLVTPYIYYEKNTLNRKQFASAGTLLVLKLRMVYGNEITDPGSTAHQQIFRTAYHQWFQLRFNYESYYKRKGRLRLGFATETVVSTQDFFSNYTASILAAPQFNPIPEAATFFLDKYRAYSYSTFGLKNVINIIGSLDLRLEAYIFQPYNAIHSNQYAEAYYGKPLSYRNYIANSGLVYHTPIGPLSLNFNYYSASEKPVSLLFSFGYIMFNKRALE
ncbi:MAG: patatin-like phospholipase family protein [Bacteroidia bacterium]|nr:patatin-like phospholipase family protein [Bacteroidia bacterium]